MSLKAACRWCKAEVSDPGAPCPRCGRRADEQPAGAIAVPDLDIPAPRVSRTMKAVAAAPPSPSPAPAPVAAAPPPKPAAALPGMPADHGSRFDDEIDGLEGGSLDLDLSKGPPMIAPQSFAKVPAAAAPARGPNEPPSAAGVQAQARGTGAGSVGTMTAPQSPRGPSGVDPYEARALSDYGDPPTKWWLTPLYAYRVLRRRPELKKVANQKKREAERAQGAAEDALLAFAELVRPAAEKLGGYELALADVRGAEQVLRERDAIAASETDAHRQRQAEADARIADLDAQLMQIQIEERQIAGELSEADILLKRADARVKRVDIEIRNALVQAGMEPPAEGGGAEKGPGP